MKRLKRMSAGVLLTCLLAVSVSAGDMRAGVVPPPPSRATSEQIEPTVTTDETSGDVIEVLKTLLQTALLMF
jgi:hypothetical protein